MFKLMLLIVIYSVTSSLAGIISSPTSIDPTYDSGIDADYEHKENTNLNHEHSDNLEYNQSILKSLLPEYQHTQPIYHHPIVKAVVAPIPYHNHQYIKTISTGPFIYKTLAQSPLIVKSPVYLGHGSFLKIAAPIAFKVGSPVEYKIPHHQLYEQNYQWN